MIFGILLFLNVAIPSIFSTCTNLYCPLTPNLPSIPCDQCSRCSQQSMKLCQSSNHTCSCVPSVNVKCSTTAGEGLEFMKVCKFRDDRKIPSPIISGRGSTAVSVVVPRFFSEPEFSGSHLSELHLIIQFHTKDKTICKDFFSIKAYKLGTNDCLMRMRIPMPGFDHKTDNHYYYDDGSELETEFPMDMFEDAEQLQLYLEVLIGSENIISDGSIILSAHGRSPPVIHKIYHQQVNKTSTTITPTASEPKK